MSKKVLVVSSERSGTHWLMDTITSNFTMEDPSIMPAFINLDEPDVMYADPDEMKKALQFLPSGAPLDGVALAHPFKSHHPFDFFEPIWDYVKSQYHVFYIARDGRDVMTSFWRHCWKVTGVGPRAFNATKFMDTWPCPPLDRYHAVYSPATMLERWGLHISSWMCELVDGVHYVKYEDMQSDFAGEVRRIGEYMGIEPPERIYAPKLAGVSPWRGVSGSWEGLLEEHMFWPEGDYAMALLGYGKEDNMSLSHTVDASGEFRDLLTGEIKSLT